MDATLLPYGWPSVKVEGLYAKGPKDVGEEIPDCFSFAMEPTDWKIWFLYILLLVAPSSVLSVSITTSSASSMIWDSRIGASSSSERLQFSSPS